MARRGKQLHKVIELQADEAELTRRMLARACHEGRTDDNPATIGQRMEVYRRQTAPLLEFYGRKGIRVTVDAMGTPDEVFARIWRGIEEPAIEGCGSAAKAQ